MSLHNALAEARWLTFAVLALVGWLVWVSLDVLGQMQPFWGPATPGRTAVAGVVGLLVMAGTVAILLTLLGELGADRRGTGAWPPDR